MTKTLPTVTAIVPVYNEEKTIAHVLTVLLDSPLIKQVVCINDGSSDNSWQEIEKFGRKITAVNLKINKGKGNAMSLGVKKAKTEIVAFIDADLVNLNQDHISQLLTPILQQQAEIVWGYHSPLSNGPPILTGERAYYKKDLLPFLDLIAETRFGVELFLNKAFKSKNTKKIYLKGLRGLWKVQKVGYLWGVKEYALEFSEILKEIGRQQKITMEEYQFINSLDKLFPTEELRQGLIRMKQVNRDNYSSMKKISKTKLAELKKLLLDDLE